RLLLSCSLALTPRPLRASEDAPGGSWVWKLPAPRISATSGASSSSPLSPVLGASSSSTLIWSQPVLLGAPTSPLPWALWPLPHPGLHPGPGPSSSEPAPRLRPGPSGPSPTPAPIPVPACPPRSPHPVSAHRRMGDNTSPISVILVSSGSRGNKLLFRYPFQRSQEHPASQTSQRGPVSDKLPAQPFPTHRHRAAARGAPLPVSHKRGQADPGAAG
uniref:NPR3 like, GATOR1 complex subunit n=1 Tax=Lynx canadensis TaxID=61383 RepID=A0A667H4B1_LYNCA